MTDDWTAARPAVLSTVDDLLEDGRKGVLATVVAVDGSAYRRPGATMVVTPDGEAGSITAGCLEAEVRALADEVLSSGRARVVTYDLTGDDDVWGLGIGCDGVVRVLVEPVDRRHRPAVAASEAGRDVVACTVLGDGDSGDGSVAPTGEDDADDTGGSGAAGTGDTDDIDGPEGVVVGDRVYLSPRGGDDAENGTDADDPVDWDVVVPDGSAVPDWLSAALCGPAQAALDDGSADAVRVDPPDEVPRDRPVELFVDGQRAPPSLVVCGAGRDVVPVVDLARQVGFRVTVVGFRGVDPDRFPDARVRSTSPRDLRAACEFDGDTYALVMTHNFVDDRLAVGELLETPVPYVGLMGPRERFAEMVEAFDSEGRRLSATDRGRIYTPVGLDLGAGTPNAIAVAVVAELLAVHNDRRPGHLADREGPIHRRSNLTAGGTDGTAGDDGPDADWDADPDVDPDANS